MEEKVGGELGMGQAKEGEEKEGAVLKCYQDLQA